ncbi:sensor histidine kinase [Nitriliruptor alkaliphilus]|uniref:sensor histidine kinase n=1 Tax=Nitriliruptor alkaliphilus TaxID=427918 RepID=UPI00069662EB|nr:HAMP domain-containing sensor histidine kinase [Nitriliruptor alkaliphilus]
MTGEAPPPPPIDAGVPALARQLVRRVVVPLLVGFLVFLVPLVVLSVRDARTGLEQQAELRAAALALIARDVLGTGGPIVAIEDLPRLPGEQVALILPSGGQLQASAPLPEEVRRSPVITAALRGGIQAERLPAIGAVVAAAPVITGARVNGAAVTILPSDEADARVRSTLLLLGVLSTGLLVVAVVAGRSLARTIVRPIATLDLVAGRLAAGDLDARAPTDLGPSELRRLAVTLNRSVDRLQDALAQQRRFVADASHQLRTPLTGLRLRLEAAEMAAGDDQGRLAAAVAEVDRLTALVGDLLLLARTEAQGEGDRSAVADVDVVPVAEERVATWVLLGQERGVAVRADVPDGPVTASVRPGALEQVLDNLLANALRVAPAGSGVDVTVGEGPNVVLVTVADRGPGLTDDQRARAFDRFWRASDAAAGGSGLGLAIVRELVRASGGDVALHPRDGGGLVAEVRLRPAGR